MAPRNVVFDVGDVLLHWDPHAPYRALLPDEAAIRAFFDEIDFYGWNLENDRGHGWDRAVAELSAKFPHRADLIRVAHQQWGESITGPIEGTVEILRRLKAAGVPLYAITNFSEKWAEAQARYDFLRESFIDVVVSAEERLVKPDPRIYEVLLKRNALKPEDCVFIDDRLANVEAARGVGMAAIHFQSPEALERDLRALGVAGW